MCKKPLIRPHSLALVGPVGLVSLDPGTKELSAATEGDFDFTPPHASSTQTSKVRRFADHSRESSSGLADHPSATSSSSEIS